MRGSILAAALSACLVSGTASAQGWLTGGSAGATKQYDYEVGGPVSKTDDTDTGFRVFGGYMFLKGLGVVASYVDLGDAYYDGSAWGGFTDTLGADGWDLSFLGGFSPGDQDKWRLFATVGAFTWKQDVAYEDASGFYPYEDSGTSLSYGAGVEFAFTPVWGLHFSYQRFTNVGDESNSGHEYDRDLVSIGAAYHFGR